MTAKAKKARTVAPDMPAMPSAPHWLSLVRQLQPKAAVYMT